MQGGFLFAVLAAFIEALRNARWPAALARLDARAARGYALSIAYLLQARLWTLFHGEPRWRALQAGWARDEGTASVREALAGTLAASDRFEIIGGGAAGFAPGSASTSPPTTCNPTTPGSPPRSPSRRASHEACAYACWWIAT